MRHSPCERQPAFGAARGGKRSTRKPIGSTTVRSDSAHRPWSWLSQRAPRGIVDARSNDSDQPLPRRTREELSRGVDAATLPTKLAIHSRSAGGGSHPTRGATRSFSFLSQPASTRPLAVQIALTLRRAGVWIPGLASSYEAFVTTRRPTMRSPSGAIWGGDCGAEPRQHS